MPLSTDLSEDFMKSMEHLMNRDWNVNSINKTSNISINCVLMWLEQSIPDYYNTYVEEHIKTIVEILNRRQKVMVAVENVNGFTTALFMVSLYLIYTNKQINCHGLYTNRNQLSEESRVSNRMIEILTMDKPPESIVYDYSFNPSRVQDIATSYDYRRSNTCSCEFRGNSFSLNYVNLNDLRDKVRDGYRDDCGNYSGYNNYSRGSFSSFTHERYNTNSFIYARILNYGDCERVSLESAQQLLRSMDVSLMCGVILYTEINHIYSNAPIDRLRGVANNIGLDDFLIIR